MTYKVRRGDTLSEIAERFNVTVRELMTWNRLRQSSSLRTGQRLVLYVDPSRANRRLNTVGFLAGKRALIVGLATERSIAHGIATAMHREGAELAFTYQNDRLQGSRASRWRNDFGSAVTVPMDVASRRARSRPRSRRSATPGIARHHRAFGRVRAARATRRRLSRQRHARGLPGRARHFELQPGRAGQGRPAIDAGTAPGAIVTLSYLGAVRSIPSYNVMGLAKASLEANVRFLAADLGPQDIRVNAISAGPIKTLAAAGVGGFRKMLAHVAAATPLRRNVTIEEVGNAAAFLCSDLASGITGGGVFTPHSAARARTTRTARSTSSSGAGCWYGVTRYLSRNTVTPTVLSQRCISEPSFSTARRW